jgi:hypothetical protein
MACHSIGTGYSQATPPLPCSLERKQQERTPKTQYAANTIAQRHHGNDTIRAVQNQDTEEILESGNLARHCLFRYICIFMPAAHPFSNLCEPKTNQPSTPFDR